MHKDVDEFMFNFNFPPPFLYSIVFTCVSWRKVDISPLLKREEDEQEEGMVGLLFYILVIINSL